MVVTQRRILLVNPWIYDFAAYNFWVKPLGILTLASLMRAAGMHVRVIDCLDADRMEPSRNGTASAGIRSRWGAGKFRSEEIPKPAALRTIPRRYRRYGMSLSQFRSDVSAAGRPDLVIMSSMMTYWYPGVFEAIRLIREIWPGVPVVLGGTYATLCPDHARARSGADFVLPGDGEFVLPPLLRNIFGGSVEFAFDGDNLDSYPYPSLDLAGTLEAVPILTSRGCPYRCSYCASRQLTRKYRTRDPIRVVDEIEYWHKSLGIQQVVFYDDALLVDAAQRTIPMLEETIRRGIPLNFHCPNGLHLRELTPPLAHLLFRAGFRTIRFGFETASAIRQADTGGKVFTEELYQAVAYLREAGYQPRDIGVYLLYGLPGQEYGEIEEGIELVRDVGARPILAEYSPIPGTMLWDDAVRSARYAIADDPLFHNNTLIPCLSSDVSATDVQSLKNRTHTTADRRIPIEKD